MTDHTASELLSLLVALDGYCHFDETGCECTDEYAALKARARVICAAACAAADEKDEQIEFLVTATCINPDGPSDAEDEDVPEITSVFIPAGTPLAFAREEVLDYFHDHVCVGCLDDFKIRVELPHGAPDPAPLT